MYVETIFCENMGPIEKAVIKAGFTPEGNPKPIVLVGKNGSGKSIMLSNIVDALHEIGDQAFSNITKKSHNGHKYLKIASGSQRAWRSSAAARPTTPASRASPTRRACHAYSWATPWA